MITIGNLAHLTVVFKQSVAGFPTKVFYSYEFLDLTLVSRDDITQEYMLQVKAQDCEPIDYFPVYFGTRLECIIAEKDVLRRLSPEGITVDEVPFITLLVKKYMSELE